MATLKKLEYKTPNKIKCDTGHKEFDRFCNFIGTGNVIADGQISSFIRPHSETECNGRTWAPGELQEFDLRPFLETRIISPNIARIVRESAKEQAVILYVFSHFRAGKRVTHGAVVTDEKHHLFHKFVTGPTRKSEAVIDWCLPYISLPA